MVEYVVEDTDGNIRIDRYLTHHLKEYTRSFIQKLIKNKQVTVNDQIIKASYKIEKADKIVVIISKEKPVTILPEKMFLDILYEDQNIIVVNKKQGMIVHPAPGYLEGTLVNGLLSAYPGNLSTMNGKIRPGIVHRIDKDTSGALLIAKNNITHEKLATMFKKQLVKRKYCAVVHGNFDETEGIIEEPIGRHPTYRIKRIVTDKNARYARTSYKVLQQFEGFSYVELTLHTGRTHQIRVHMNHIHHPLVGDPLYGPKKHPFGLKGQALHAKALGFEHPTTGENILVDAPLPLYFTKLINRLMNEYPLR